MRDSDGGSRIRILSRHCVRWNTAEWKKSEHIKDKSASIPFTLIDSFCLFMFSSFSRRCGRDLYVCSMLSTLQHQTYFTRKRMCHAHKMYASFSSIYFLDILIRFRWLSILIISVPFFLRLLSPALCIERVRLAPFSWNAKVPKQQQQQLSIETRKIGSREFYNLGRARKCFPNCSNEKRR